MAFTTITLPLLLLLSTTLIPPTSACVCPTPLETTLFLSSSTVVKAVVQSVDPFTPMCRRTPCPPTISPTAIAPCDCPMQPCTHLCRKIPCPGVKKVDPGVGNVRYNFRLLQTITGCPPTSEQDGHFIAVTFDHKYSCSVLYSVDDIVVLNLPSFRCDGPPGSSVFYRIDRCQGHRIFDKLSDADKYAIKVLANDEDGRCESA